MNLKIYELNFSSFEKKCFYSIEIIEKMEFHSYIRDLLDTMPEGSTTLVNVQVSPSPSTRTSSSSATSLFQDYFNNNEDDNRRLYDEFEAYINVKIPNVSGN